LKYRSEAVVEKRMAAIEKAFLAKDFDTFGQLTMADSNQFHATCLDTFPPIFYMNDISRSIIRIVHAYNQWAGQVRAAYTFDAGPNAVLYTLDEYAVEVGALMLHYYSEHGSSYVNHSDFLAKIKGHTLDASLLESTDKTGRTPKAGDVKMLYYTKSGSGPQKLGPEESNLDLATGLNVYQP
jgi:diphosphomevalonate decarboxylase